MRPSELYCISDQLSAFYFDRAVATFGLALEAAVNEAGEKAKTSAKAAQARQRVLDDWLEIPGRKFRDPVGTSNITKGSSESSGIVQL